MKKADRLSEIKPSLTLEITARSKSMQAEGIDVIGLGAGEPDFDTPGEVVESAMEALRQGFTRYTPVAGIPALREAICRKLEKDNDLKYAPEEVLLSCGAKHSLYNIFMALLNPGEEVLIPTPAWLSYPEMVRLAGGRPVFVPTTEEDGFLADAGTFSGYLTPRTRFLIINSPSNPTGGAYDAERLKALGQFAIDNGLLVISDEIYEKLVYDDFVHTSIASLMPEMKGRTIVVNGFSKSFAMTGWRLGYAAGPRELISAMTTVQSHSTSNPTSFAQKGALKALELDPQVIGQIVAEFERRRTYLVGRLQKMEGISCFMPRGAFYAFPDFSGHYGKEWKKERIASSLDMAAYLLEEGRVAIVPGAAFQADGHLRISFATSMENLEKAADRIEEALGRLS